MKPKKRKNDQFSKQQTFDEDDEVEESIPTIFGERICTKKICNPSDYMYENMGQSRME